MMFEEEKQEWLLFKERKLNVRVFKVNSTYEVHASIIGKSTYTDRGLEKWSTIVEAMRALIKNKYTTLEENKSPTRLSGLSIF
ncbi:MULTISPECIES: hypothetical protein [Bacillus]|uniref:hypothetical protein n=1 Tax=Bacillus TaxID=1386 RepID=UPI001B01C950|nr:MULTISPECIES: hypothetical protein [Bacillus]MDE1385315.1 hypothetical protein [Bacillus paralicheniformis]GIN78047.1 hypothetical protein J41TS8_30880 [Bacillus sp. J41TS8]